MTAKKTKQDQTIVIVGGGFGGVRCALDLARYNLPQTRIVLITRQLHFEYHPALYRVVTGRTPLEVCIPLDAIFPSNSVELIQDSVTQIDPQRKVITTRQGLRVPSDYLILALGSETAYFGIQGLAERALGFKSIEEALKLKRQLHTSVDAMAELPETTQTQPLEYVVVGAGPSGVELAGELAIYLKKLTFNHGLKPSLVTINLVEAADRVLPTFRPAVSEIASRRLHDLGVRLILKQRVQRETIEQLFLSSMTMRARTVIWTAGTQINQLYRTIRGLHFTRQGRVRVNQILEVSGRRNVFVLGDAAATPFSGLAQTAISDGSFIARTIRARHLGEPTPHYQPHKPSYAVPIGPGWALTVLGRFVIAGRLGWLLRRAADFRFLLSILPLTEALAVFRNGEKLRESCSTCCPALDNS